MPSAYSGPPRLAKQLIQDVADSSHHFGITLRNRPDEFWPHDVSHKLLGLLWCWLLVTFSVEQGQGREQLHSAFEHGAVIAAFPDELEHFIAESVAERLRSEEHTSELQSLRHLVCRLL